MEFPGEVHYAATAAEVDAVAPRVLDTLPRPATVGIDFEWWFQGSQEGPIATIQLCWEEGGGRLHAAVLHVARLAPRHAARTHTTGSLWERHGVAPERMTPRLRELLHDGSMRKVTFGNFDQKKFLSTFGWRVANMVDLQPCLGRAFGGTIDDIWHYPRLAEAAAWVLGVEVDKQMQTSNGWEEERPLSDAEIAYVATDAYAHLMLWRAALHYESLHRPLPAADAAADAAGAAAGTEGAQGAHPAPAAAGAAAAAAGTSASAALAAAEPAAAGATGATAAEPARPCKRARQGSSGSDSEAPPAKQLAAGTEEQEQEPPLAAPTSQADSEGTQPSGGASQDSDAVSDGGSQGAADAADPAETWTERILARHLVYGRWRRDAPLAQEEANRQERRRDFVEEIRVSEGAGEAAAADAALEEALQPEPLPLAEPEGGEQLAARLLQATPAARQ